MLYLSKKFYYLFPDHIQAKIRFENFKRKTGYCMKIFIKYLIITKEFHKEDFGIIS